MPAPDDRFFANVTRRPCSTSAGPCELPILYWGASLATLVYRVEPAKVRPYVGVDFEPWVTFGKATAMMCFFEYRETTIGPYGEVGLGVMVKRKGTKPSLFGALRDMRREADAGLWIINLPVTTEGARAAGKELWGYPKYVTPMDMQFRDDGVRFGLGSELRLTMGPSRGVKSAGIPFVLFSVDATGRILRTIVDVDHRQTWGGAKSAKLEVTGDGPTARTVQALGIEAARPVVAFRTDGMRSILPAGVAVGMSAGVVRAGREGGVATASA